MSYPTEFETLEQIITSVNETLESVQSYEPVDSRVGRYPHAAVTVGSWSLIDSWVDPQNPTAGVDINRNMIRFNPKFGASLCSWHASMSSFLYSLSSYAYAGYSVNIGVVLGAVEEMVSNAAHWKNRMSVESLGVKYLRELATEYREIENILCVFQNFLYSYRGIVLFYLEITTT